MSNNQFLPPWIKVNTIQLNRYDFRVSRTIPDYEIRDRAIYSERRSFIKNDMVIDMQTYLYGRTLKGFFVERPSNWFEAWKENAYCRGYLGPWAKKLWPVRYDREELKATEMYPSVSSSQNMKRVIMYYTDERL